MNPEKQGTAKNTSTPKPRAGKNVRSAEGISPIGVSVLAQQPLPSNEPSASKKATSLTGKNTLTDRARIQGLLQTPSTPLPDEKNPMLKVITCIKSARQKQNLTQQQLADAVGVHVSFIAHLETLKENDALPSYARTAALERVLGLEERELWELTEAVRAVKGSKRAQALKQFHDLELELKGFLSKPETVNQPQAISENAKPLVNNQVQVEVEDEEEVESVSEMCNDFTTLLGGNPAHRRQAGLALRQIIEKAREENSESQKDERKKGT